MRTDAYFDRDVRTVVVDGTDPFFSYVVLRERGEVIVRADDGEVDVQEWRRRIRTLCRSDRVKVLTRALPGAPYAFAILTGGEWPLTPLRVAWGAFELACEAASAAVEARQEQWHRLDGLIVGRTSVVST